MTTAGRFATFDHVIELSLEATATGAILIRGPDAFAADGPDMAFVCYPADGTITPFLPGSSLKGVLRSGAESLLRALNQDSCLDRNDRCHACLTFGSTVVGSVVLVEDGLPWPPDASLEDRHQALERILAQRTVRTGVAIDRQRGTAVSPFDYEVLLRPSFYPTVRLRNPQPWQAALVASGLDLINQGLLRVGSGTSRGLGRVTIRYRRLDIIAAGRLPALYSVLDWTPETLAGPLLRFRAAQPAAAARYFGSNLQHWLEAS